MQWTSRCSASRPRALQAANHEWFHGTTDADLPASTLWPGAQFQWLVGEDRCSLQGPFCQSTWQTWQWKIKRRNIQWHPFADDLLIVPGNPKKQRFSIAMFDCCQKVFIHFLLYVLVRFHALRQGLVGCAAGHQVTEELAIRLGEARWKLLALLYNIIKGSWEAILPSYEWLLLDGIDYDEVWSSSETWPWWRVVWDFTLHNNTSEKNSLWWRVVWDFTLHNNTSENNWLWWRVVWDFTLHNNTSEKNSLWRRVVWDFTLHNNTSEKNSLWWRVVWDFTLHNNTSENNWLWWSVVWDSALHNNTAEKNWLWWRVVWDFTLQNNTSEKNWLWWRVVEAVELTLMKGGRSHNNT